MKKLLSLCLALGLCLGLSVPALGAEVSFADVPTPHWAYEYIQRAADNGWVRGTSEGIYSPTDPVTNSAFLTVLTRAFYPKDVEHAAINGVGGDWWEPYCSTAALHGLPQGTAIGDVYYSSYKWDKDLLSAPISRYDMAQMMLNYMSNNDFTVSEREKKEAQSKIGDWSEIPAEYRDGVSACYALGVISGTSAGTFEGERGMTRAEMAVVLVRLSDATGNGSTPTPEPTPTPTPEPTPTPKPSGSYAPADANKDGILTDDEVYEALMAFKEEVPAGTPWTAANTYTSATAGLGRGSGCAAFMLQASDQAFNLPARTISSIDEMRIGDIVHFTSPSHWMIVTEIGDEYYYGADGSSESDGVVSWNARGNLERTRGLMSEGAAIIYTRYPK